MKNSEIYNYSQKLFQAFSSQGENKFPIKLSFKIQKNKKLFLDLGMEIEKNILSLQQKYGHCVTEGDKTQILIPAENIEVFQQEYNDLMEIEQEINFATIQIDELSDSIEISNQEMEAILFMIEE